MEVNIEQVYRAIEVFNGQNPTDSSAAAKWLSDFQKSWAAWEISDQLLLHQNYHAAYFGAQTMRHKILYDIKELPQNNYEALRDSLIQHLKRVESLNPDQFAVVIKQLALALADLYLQVPEWLGFIVEIVNMFTSGGDASLHIMLELLMVFPEELQEKKLKLGANRREAIQSELASNFDTVVNCLTLILNSHQNDSRMVKRVIRCIQPWINNPSNRSEGFAQSSLLENMLMLLTVTNAPSDIYDANCEALSAACILCGDITSHMQLCTVLQNGIYNSVETFRNLIAAEDFDKVGSLARLYVELAESFLPEVAHNPGNGLGDLRTLDLMLLVVDQHDYSLVEMTFNVWYRVSEYMFQVGDDELYEMMMEKFRPYIERYIMSLFRHCQLEPDTEEIMDDNEDFMEFRARAAESIKDVAFIIGTVTLMRSMVSLIKTKENATWSEVESALFIASQVVSNCTGAEETTMPELLNMLYSLPINSNVCLLNTATILIGAVPEWFEESGNEELMVMSIRWLLTMSQHPALYKSIAESLECLCRLHFTRLRQFFDDFVQLKTKMETSQVNGVRVEAAAQAIIRCCSYLLNDLPAAELGRQLESLCSDSILRLQRVAFDHKNGTRPAANENAQDSWARASQDPIVWLDRITSVFKVLKPWNNQIAFRNAQAQHNVPSSAIDNVPELQVPWLDLGTRVWTAISATIDAFKDSYRIVEHSCRCTRYLIRSMGMKSVVFIGSLASLIVQVYNEHSHSCFLYLASVIVDEYSAFESVQHDLIQMGRVIAERSFQLFKAANGLINNPDTVDDLFRLAIRFVQRMPSPFFAENFSKDLFKYAIMGLNLDHSEAHRSVCKFFTETLETVKVARQDGQQHPSLAKVDRLFHEFGEELVWDGVNGALFRVSYGLKKDIAEVLFETMHAYPQLFDKWLQSTVQRLAVEHRLGASEAQLETFHRNALNAKRIGDFNFLLRELCHLYA